MKETKTQREKLNYLLERFKEDSVRYKDLRVDDDYSSKRMALRSLMNIRMPKEIGRDVLHIQDEFLTAEAAEKGVVELSAIKTIKEQYGSNRPFSDKISLWQGDITRLSVDAIVNAANSQMLGCFIPCHGCIDNAIHSAAGIQLRAECDDKMKEKRRKYGARYEEPTGQALLTGAYNLPARYVIHTVGPIVGSSLTSKLRQELKSCYESVMRCCVENNIRSVALSCISTGEFHFPNDEAAVIATDTVTEALEKSGEHFERIIFNVFKDIDMNIYENLLA